MKGTTEMYEDNNGTMVPDSTVLRDLHSAFHHGLAETVTELFGEVGPFEPNPTEETIDDDPSINALLAANKF